MIQQKLIYYARKVANLFKYGVNSCPHATSPLKKKEKKIQREVNRQRSDIFTISCHSNVMTYSAQFIVLDVSQVQWVKNKIK